MENIAKYVEQINPKKCLGLSVLSLKTRALVSGMSDAEASSATDTCIDTD